MTYYQRYIKIMPTTNKKNYPLSKLLFNYTGHDYEPLDFKGTYNDNTANECVEIFSKSLTNIQINLFKLIMLLH